MINWREKFIATAVHFGVTLAFAAIAAAVIFFIWFPHPLEIMIGGLDLFLLLVGCDVVLGPMLSLVLYNSRKTRRALIVDYTLIGICQLGALLYGVYVVSGTRPVYIAFNSDRYEIVSARDISEKELAAARDPRYAGLPWTGPKLVSVVIPPEDREDAMFEAIAGNEEHLRPKFFAPLAAQLPRILERAKPVSVLVERKPDSRADIEKAAADTGLPAERLRWLPTRHLKGFWTALIDANDGKPVGWIPLDPYEE